MCAQMWVHMLVEVRDWRLRSFSVTLLFFETESLTERGPYQWVPGIHFFTHHPGPSAGITGAWLFMWVLQIWTQGLGMRHRYFTDGTISSCPCVPPHPLAFETRSSHKEPGRPGTCYKPRWVLNLQSPPTRPLSVGIISTCYYAWILAMFV